MNGERIGKIESARFGIGGYQDAQFGLTVTLVSDKDSWSVGSFDGFWASAPGSGAEWDVEKQNAAFASTMRKTLALLKDAKVQDVAQLVGAPVTVIFDGNVLKEWRILTEAI